MEPLTWRRLPGEPKNAYDAFLFYCRLGPARTLTAVADHLYVEKHGKPRPSRGIPRAIRNWADRYLWRERAKLYDLDQARSQSQQFDVLRNAYLRALAEKLRRGLAYLEALDLSEHDPKSAVKILQQLLLIYDRLEHARRQEADPTYALLLDAITGNRQGGQTE